MQGMDGCHANHSNMIKYNLTAEEIFKLFSDAAEHKDMFSSVAPGRSDFLV